MNAILAFLLLMLDFATPRPLQEAIDSLSAKTPIGAALRSPDWQRVPLALRQRAFFSAAVESARFLQTAQDQLLNLAKLQRRQLAGGGEGAFLSREKFVVEMRALANRLGIDTTRGREDDGTLRDITSDARLGMIFDIQTQQAAEFAKWKMEQDADVLDAFPAQELIRVEEREMKRDWSRRWVEKGGTLREGRMIALKNDPIWSKLSRFGTPWPPFDFNSGMGLDDIGRDEAERLGLLKPDEPVMPVSEDFNAQLKASVRGLSDRMRGALKTIFDDQIDIAGDEARWNSDTDHEARRHTDREIARSIAGRVAETFRRVRSGAAGDARRAGRETAADRELDRRRGAEIGSVAAGRKPLYHEQLDDAAEAAADVLRGALDRGVEVRALDGRLYVYRPDTLPVSVEEAHRLSLEGRNGELLGYGSPSMFEPGNVQVILRNEAGAIVGGFRAPKETASVWGKRRANDYQIAWNERITAEVGPR